MTESSIDETIEHTKHTNEFKNRPNSADVRLLLLLLPNQDDVLEFNEIVRRTTTEHRKYSPNDGIKRRTFEIINRRSAPTVNPGP